MKIKPMKSDNPQNRRSRLCWAIFARLMKTPHIITLLLLVDCCGVIAQTTNARTQTNTATITIQKPQTTAPFEKQLPTWYVFKIKAFHKVTYSGDRTSAVIEGVTLKDREFKIKVLWDATFKGNHQRCVDEWLKRSKANFEAGLPYVISGMVISRDPLTIEPDTVVDKAPNFGAPAENVY